MLPLLLGGLLVLAALVFYLIFGPDAKPALGPAASSSEETEGNVAESAGRIPTGFRVLRQIGSGGKSFLGLRGTNGTGCVCPNAITSTASSGVWS